MLLYCSIISSSSELPVLDILSGSRSAVTVAFPAGHTYYFITAEIGGVVRANTGVGERGKECTM